MKDITLKSSLESHWKKKCSLAMDGIYQKPLTGKERGQLKMLAKYLGGNEQAKEVISYAVEHWWKFAVAASAAADTGMPTEPHIGYLLKHHEGRPVFRMVGVLCDTLAEARAQVPTGTYRFPRDESDDAVIVETWI